MALCRLLQSRQSLHFQNRAFLGSRRWFCACPSTDMFPAPAPPPPREAKKKKKMESVRLFLERYMLSHPGVFPKLKEVQNEVGGSFYLLKEIVSKLRTDMLPGSENKQPGTLDSCATAKSATEVRVIEESADPCKLDTPEKEIIAEPRTEMFPGSENKQLGIAESCATTKSTSEVRVIDESMYPCKLDTPGKGSNLLTEKLDKKLFTATVSTTVKSSDASRPIEVINTEQSKNNLTHSATVLAQKLLNTDHQTVKKGAITSNADMFVSEAQLTGVTDSVKENYCTDTNYLAPNHNAQETRIHSQAPNQISSAVESNKLRNVRPLLDFFKNDAEKRLGTSCRKVNNPEQEKHSYLEERNRNNLLHLFTSKPSVSSDSNSIHEKNTRQSISSHPREECAEDIVRKNGGVTDSKGTQVNNILEKIIRGSKEKQTNGSSDNALLSKPSKPILNPNHLGLANNVTSMKTNIVNEETGGSEPESLNFQNISKGLRSSIQLNKAKVWKPAVQTDIAASKEASILNFVAKVDREEQKESTIHGIENRKLPCGKYSTAMDSSGVPLTEFMSDESDSDVAAFDYTKPESNDEVPVPVQGSNLNANSIMVKFLLKTAKTSDIGLAFGDCGPIAELFIVPSRKDNRYNYSYVRFKTEDGLRKALDKTDVAICGADVVVEPVAPSVMHKKLICIESPSDADFPISFLKNPDRTVMIQGLPENTSFYSVSSELSNWGHVSGFAMGSSSSSVYVEFESEEMVERVLSEATFSVSGTKLWIYSVNHPRTTVLRISNVNPTNGPVKIRSICDSFGQVKRLIVRGIDTFDVHFASTEWSNMLKILNKMNGLVSDQYQWVVKPATVVPAEVLDAIWSEPDGRKHIHELIQDLCRRIEEKAIDTAPLRDLAQKYYGDV